jgi:hypothetical protein
VEAQVIADAAVLVTGARVVLRRERPAPPRPRRGLVDLPDPDAPPRPDAEEAAAPGFAVLPLYRWVLPASVTAALVAAAGTRAAIVLL